MTAGHLWNAFTQMQEVEEEGTALIVRGKGPFVYDAQGREYLDAMGGLWNMNVGYGREEIIQAVTRQLQELPYFSLFSGFSNPPAEALAERLAELLQPEGLTHVFFSSGGSEAVETAIKLARQYWRLKGHPHKYKLIARRRAYHGVTLGALSLTGISANRKMFEPLLPGCRHITPPYCYRCDLGRTYPECDLACAEELQSVLRFEGADTVAAFFVEPVMGAGGVIVPPEDYLPRVRDLCDRNQVLLVVDEVITGFGRTGEWFGVRHAGVRPDFMILAKGINSGYIPLGATAVREEIYRAFLAKPEEFLEFRHGYTYSGHPAACAAALVNLDIIEREGLVENAREVGRHLLAGLRDLSHHPTVGDVNGLGLLCRVELVEDRATRKAFPPQRLVGKKVAKLLFKNGVTIRALGDVLAFSPSLILTKGQADRMVEAVDLALRAFEKDTS